MGGWLPMWMSTPTPTFEASATWEALTAAIAEIINNFFMIPPLFLLFV
jgi:hypothetical protein